MKLSLNRLKNIPGLAWPSILVSGAYGVGFVLIRLFTDVLGPSSLFTAMTVINPAVPVVWGMMAIVLAASTIFTAMYKLDGPGRTVASAGVLLWLFACVVYIQTGGWLTLFSVSLPSLIFWIIWYTKIEHWK